MIACARAWRYDNRVGTFALGVQVLLAAVFATAGAAKLLDQAGSRRALIGFGVPKSLAPALGGALPIAEIAVALSLVPRPSARWGTLCVRGELRTATASASFILPRPVETRSFGTRCSLGWRSFW
jgi:hypothetical protein